MALSTRDEPRSPMRGEQLGQKFLTVSPYLSLPGNKRLQPSTTPRAWPDPSLQQALWLVTQGLSLPPTPLQLLSWESCSHKFCSTLNPDLPALGPRTQHPVSTHWLLLESDHLNPNPSLSATPWGWSSLSPQSVATAPPHLDPVPTVLFCTSLCLLQHSSYPAASPATPQAAGPAQSSYLYQLLLALLKAVPKASPGHAVPSGPWSSHSGGHYSA